MNTTEIFEIVDATNEEAYYPLGISLSLDHAIKEIQVDDPSDIGCDEADDYDGHRIVEIRRREAGWSGRGECVFRSEWTNHYDEEKDEYFWKRKDTAL